MTLPSWDKEWLRVHCKPLRMEQAWRAVETQYIAASMKLVDDFAEQNLLEQMLERHKPAIPPIAQKKHYLLLSPFRYSPAHSSRFRPAYKTGLWYGASTLEGACAEIAYWRHRFLADMAEPPDDGLLTEHTFYKATVDGLAIDLMDKPWAALAHAWKHPTDYTATHALAAACEDTPIQWIQYESVRAPTCALAAVLTPTALQSTDKQIENAKQDWVCKTTPEGVLLRAKNGTPMFEWRP